LVFSGSTSRPMCDTTFRDYNSGEQCLGSGRRLHHIASLPSTKSVLFRLVSCPAQPVPGVTRNKKKSPAVSGLDFHPWWAPHLQQPDQSSG
jgi:hypothetical protein